MATEIANSRPLLIDSDTKKVVGFADIAGPLNTEQTLVFGEVNPVTGGISLSVGEATLLPTAFTVKAAIGIAGQSNEQGNTLYADSLGVWQRAAVASPSQNIYEPVKLSTAGFGSMFVAVAELLAGDGVQVDLHNGAVGGSSFYVDWCGFVYMAGRSNSTAYRGKRTTLGTGDPGHRGDFVFVNGATWEATTGNKHLVFYSDSTTPQTVAGTAYYSDPGTVVKETTLLTAASPPVFPGSPAVSNTVVDGSITWTCIHVGAKTTDASNIHVNRTSDDGFDPYYMCVRLRNSLMSAPVSTNKRFVYFQNGQVDAGIATAIYTMSLRMLGQYLGVWPYFITPIFGLSIMPPTHLTANWDLIETTLSGTGIAGTPNYATSPLTTALVSGGFHLATPGETITSFGIYYGQSLYRSFGADTTSLLQPSSPHVTLFGMYACANAIAPTLSKILRNSAT